MSILLTLLFSLSSLVSLGVVYHSSRTGALIAGLFSIGWMFLGRWRSSWLALSLVPLIAVSGELSLLFHVKGVSLALPVVLSALAGFFSIFNWDNFSALLQNNSQRKSAFFLLIFYLAYLVFSSSRAVFSYGDHFFQWNSVVAETPWATIFLKNAFGWIVGSLLQYFAGFGLMIYFLVLSGTEGSKNKIFDWIVNCWTLVAFVGVIQFVGTAYFQKSWCFQEHPIVIRSLFYDQNAFGFSMALTFVLGLALLEIEKITAWKILGIWGFLCSVLISGSRSALLGTTIGGFAVVALAILKKGDYKNLIALVAGVAVLSVGLFVPLKSRSIRWTSSLAKIQKASDILIVKTGEGTREEGIQTLLDSRYMMWKAGWIVFKHNPLFGVGVGNYLIQMPAYKNEIGSILNDNSGNQYLHMAAEQGAIGLAFFLSLLGLAFRRLWLLENQAPSKLLLAPPFLGALVMFIFSAPLIQFDAAFLFWIVLGLSLSKSDEVNNP